MTTPLAETEGTAFAAPLVAVPILRAGLGMLEAVTELFPEVPVGYLGLERDHATFQPSTYYSKLPDIGGSYVLLLDPMLATGGSAAAACASLFAAGPARSRCCRWWPRPRACAGWRPSTRRWTWSPRRSTSASTTRPTSCPGWVISGTGCSAPDRARF